MQHGQATAPLLLHRIEHELQGPGLRHRRGLSICVELAAGALPSIGVATGALPFIGNATGALPFIVVATGALPSIGVATGAPIAQRSKGQKIVGVATGALSFIGVEPAGRSMGSMIVGVAATGALTFIEVEPAQPSTRAETIRVATGALPSMVGAQGGVATGAVRMPNAQ